MSHRHLIVKPSALLLVVLAMAMVFATSKAEASEASPPIGAWQGTFPDGSKLDLMLQANGDAAYGPHGYQPTVGWASWNSSSPVGGILTITYFNAGIRSNMYLSVVWTSATSFQLSDPYFKVEMHAAR